MVCGHGLVTRPHTVTESDIKMPVIAAHLLFFFFFFFLLLFLKAEIILVMAVWHCLLPHFSWDLCPRQYLSGDASALNKCDERASGVTQRQRESMWVGLLKTKTKKWPGGGEKKKKICRVEKERWLCRTGIETDIGESESKETEKVEMWLSMRGAGAGIVHLHRECKEIGSEWVQRS